MPNKSIVSKILILSVLPLFIFLCRADLTFATIIQPGDPDYTPKYPDNMQPEPRDDEANPQPGLPDGNNDTTSENQPTLTSPDYTPPPPTLNPPKVPWNNMPPGFNPKLPPPPPPPGLPQNPPPNNPPPDNNPPPKDPSKDPNNWKDPTKNNQDNKPSKSPADSSRPEGGAGTPLGGGGSGLPPSGGAGGSGSSGEGSGGSQGPNGSDGDSGPSSNRNHDLSRRHGPTSRTKNSGRGSNGAGATGAVYMGQSNKPDPRIKGGSSAGAKSLAKAATDSLGKQKYTNGDKSVGCASSVCSVLKDGGLGVGSIDNTTSLASALASDSRFEKVFTGKQVDPNSLHEGDIFDVMTGKQHGHVGIVNDKKGITNNDSATGVMKNSSPDHFNHLAASRGLTISVFRPK